MGKVVNLPKLQLCEAQRVKTKKEKESKWAVGAMPATSIRAAPNFRYDASLEAPVRADPSAAKRTAATAAKTRTASATTTATTTAATKTTSATTTTTTTTTTSHNATTTPSDPTTTKTTTTTTATTCQWSSH